MGILSSAISSEVSTRATSPRQGSEGQNTRAQSTPLPSQNQNAVIVAISDKNRTTSSGDAKKVDSSFASDSKSDDKKSSTDKFKARKSISIAV